MCKITKLISKELIGPMIVIVRHATVDIGVLFPKTYESVNFRVHVF